MWIFLKDGFISVVQHEAEPDTLVIRARKLEHLFQLGTPESAILRLPDADYPFRCYMHKRTFAVVMYEKIKTIDYTNFKNTLDHDPKYHKACFNVWLEMYNAYMIDGDDDDREYVKP